MALEIQGAMALRQLILALLYGEGIDVHPLGGYNE